MAQDPDGVAALLYISARQNYGVVAPPESGVNLIAFVADSVYRSSAVYQSRMSSQQRKSNGLAFVLLLAAQYYVFLLIGTVVIVKAFDTITVKVCDFFFREVAT